MIAARNVHKKFGNDVALSDINLEITEGEFVFLTGASGSGKTTLLKLILREYLPTSGELEVNGKNLAKINTSKIHELRREMGVVFQDFRLIEDLDVFENIALPLQVTKIKTEDINSAVKIALEIVGLSDMIHQFPAQLSGGEVQRVAIARAIVSKPKIILADEPTGNLDPKTSKTIIKLLKDLHNQLKTTVIVSTHNADIVNEYNLRVLTLESGKLVKDVKNGKYE